MRGVLSLGDGAACLMRFCDAEATASVVNPNSQPAVVKQHTKRDPPAAAGSSGMKHSRSS